MKRYTIREGSFLDRAIPIAVVLLIVIMAGLGNHYIDGIGVQ